MLGLKLIQVSNKRATTHVLPPIDPHDGAFHTIMLYGRKHGKGILNIPILNVNELSICWWKPFGELYRRVNDYLWTYQSLVATNFNIYIYITYTQHKLRVVVHLYWQTALRRYILPLIIHHYFVRASCHFILGTTYRYYHEDIKFKVFLLVSKDVPFQYMPTMMDADISFMCDEWDVRLAFKLCAGAPITYIDECIFE